MGSNNEISIRINNEENPISNSIHLKDLGLRTFKNFIYYLAVENTFDSNLISDIRNVSYIEDSNGLMKLKQMLHIPFIFDDIYIYSYVFQDDVKSSNRGGITLKGDSKNEDGEVKGATKTYLDLAKFAVGQAFNYTSYTGRIFTTAEFKGKTNSYLIEAMSKIDEDKEILKRSQSWKGKEGENPVGIVGIKISVSDIPFKTVNDNIERLNEILKLSGFVIGQCDITYDQAGTLDVPALYEAFLNNGNTREQYSIRRTLERDDEDEEEDEEEAIDGITEEELHEDYYEKDILINLKNEQRRSGRNILKYVTFFNDQAIRCKYYNKLVSNFEAGNTQEKLGVHLAEYAYNHKSSYLQKVFSHPDVIEHGLTRFELSFCPSLKEKVNGAELINRELKKIHNFKIFHSQPKAKQFEKLRDAITKTCLICDKTEKKIYMVWYGSTLTHRIACINYSLKRLQDGNETDEQYLRRYEKAKKEAMSEFGFNNLVINVVEFEHDKNDKKLFHFLEPKSYSRRGPTFLAPTNTPGLKYGNNYEDLPDIKDVCPHSDNIQFVFRENGVGHAKGKNPVLNKPIKLEGQTFTISLYSRAKRKELSVIQENGYLMYDWFKRNKVDKERIEKEERERKRLLLKEKKNLEVLMEKQERADERKKTIEKDFKTTNQEEVLRKIREHGFIKIYAFKICKYNATSNERPYRILFTYGNTDEKGVCFPTKILKNWLKHDKIVNVFFREVETRQRNENYFCMPIHSLKMGITKIKEKDELTFGTKEQMDVFKTKFKTDWQKVVDAIKRFREIEEEIAKTPETLTKLPKAKRGEEKPKDLIEVEPGEYLVDAFSEYSQGNKLKRILYIKTEERRYPVTGYYLQDKLDEKIRDLTKVVSPLKLLLVQSVRHPIKKKQDRQVEIDYETI